MGMLNPTSVHRAPNSMPVTGASLGPTGYYSPGDRFDVHMTAGRYLLVLPLANGQQPDAPTQQV